MSESQPSPARDGLAPKPALPRVSLASFLLQLLNGLSSASALFLVAAGLTLIFGVTRIVNFAHGSLYMLGAYCAYALTEALASVLGRGGASFWPAMLLAALAVAAIGALLEALLLKRLYAAPELLQLTATFAVVLIVRDVALAAWGAEDLLGPRAPGLAGTFELFGRAIPQYDLFLIAVGPLVLLALTWLVTRTRFGMLIRAASEDRVLTGALGVDQARLFTAVFALGAFLAGLAGALQLPREPANLGMDLAIIADAFVVTVVGGLGSIPGAFLAALLIGLTKAICIALGNVEVAGVTFAFPKLTLVAEFVVMAVVLASSRRACSGSRKARRSRRRCPSSASSSSGPGRRDALAAAAVLALLLVVPWLRDDYTVVLATDILIAALFAASLQFLLGTGGMTSFGHAAYFGVGAYCAARRGQGRLADARGVRRRARRRARRGDRVRLVLRAPVRRLPRDADARVRADRLVDRLPVGQRDRRLQRPGRRLAGRVAHRPHALLLLHARDGGAGLRRAGPDRAVALRLRAARRARFAAARRRRSASTSSARSGAASRSPACSPASRAASSRSRRAASRPSRSRYRAPSTRWSWCCWAASTRCSGRCSARRRSRGCPTRSPASPITGARCWAC